MNSVLLWVLVGGGLVVVEMLTAELVCIWFAAGSIFAGIAAFAGTQFWVQLLILLVTSLASLFVGRPLLIDRITPKRVATNADRVIGQIGVVTQSIDNILQTGRVSANGLDWTARSAYGEIIGEGEAVLVLQIDGVKLIVEPASREPENEDEAPTGEEEIGILEESRLEYEPDGISAPPDLPQAASPLPPFSEIAD